MRILHVNQFCETVGGTEVYVDSVSRELLRKGHGVSLLCGEPAGNMGDLPYTVQKLPSAPLWSSRRDDEALDQVRDVVRSEDPDVINIHNIRNPWVTSLLQELRPTVRYLHDHALYCPGPKYHVSGKECVRVFGARCILNSYLPFACRGYLSRKPWRTWSIFRSMRRSMRANMGLARLLVASKFVKECLLQHGFASSAIEVLPYFVHLPDKIKSVGKSILYVGRLSPEKGVHVLLDALPMIPGCPETIVVGDGPRAYTDELRDRASQSRLSSRVHFVGWVRRGELERFYSLCRLVVMPSLWPEPFGIVGLEALAHARPVVAFDCGGVSDWLTDGDVGFLVPRGDVAGLAQRIGYLLDSPEKAASMGKKGRTMVSKRFSSEWHVRRLLEIYEEVRG